MRNFAEKCRRENQNTHFMFNDLFFRKSCRLWGNVEKKYRVSVKSFPDYKHLVQETLRCTSVRRVSAADNFPTSWCTSTLGFRCSSVFGMQHFQTGGLGEMVRHPGHHDRRISTPLTSFYGGMLRTKCFRHQFQILQI